MLNFAKSSSNFGFKEFQHSPAGKIFMLFLLGMALVGYELQVHKTF
jgi:hypothetical protein